MDIQEIQIDPLNLQLKVALEEQDYSKAFSSKLKEYKAEANLKGFRKGKAPMSIVRKMFGADLLKDIVINEIQKGVTDYLTEKKIEFLGQPLPTPDQDPLEISLDQKEYEMSFDLGLVPKIKLPDFENDFDLELNVASPDEDNLNDQLLQARKRFGGREEITEDAIIEEDMLDVKAVELENGKPKKDGWSSDFLILVSQVSDEKVKKKLLKSKLNDSFDFNPFTLESSKDENWAREHILYLKDENADREVNDTFNGTITRVERVVPAELNEEFFTQFFGEGIVKTEEEAMKALRDQASQLLEQKAENILNLDIKEKLEEQIIFDLPVDFLKRWIEDRNPDKGEIDGAEFEGFVSNTKWNLILQELSKTLEVEVNDDEVRDSMKESVKLFYQTRYQFYDEDYVDKTVTKMMESPESHQREYDNILYLKVMKKVADKSKPKEKKIDSKELNDHYDEIVKRFNEQKQ